MKKLIHPLLFLMCLTSCAQISDNALDKMRTFKIKNKVMIGLQMPIDSFKNVVEKDKYGRHSLKKGTFGGADKIEILLNVKNRITDFIFYYDTVSTYSYEVDLFNNHLGFKGRESQHKNGIEITTTTEWKDDFTTFKMIEFRRGKEWKLHSILSNNPPPGCYDQTLVEKAKNGTCTTDCPGVIGCDDKFYCNECNMNAVGIKRKE